MNQMHRFMSRIVPYALVILIASLVLRSLATVVSTSIPYDSWPLWLRIVVEVFAVLGMVICSEIILSAAAARRAVILVQIQQTEESDDYKPSPRLKGDALAERVALLEARKRQAVKRLEEDGKRELGAVRMGGAVTITYGVLFAVTTVHTLTPVAIVTELILCGFLPFIIYYFSARYKPEAHNPGETATVATTAALDEKVKHAGKRVLSGEYDRRDVGVLEAAAPDSPIHRKMLAALMPADASGLPELTVSEVYAQLGITEKGAKASVRRVIRKAGDAKRVIPGGDELMVRWDDQEGEWRVRQASLAFLWPGGYKPGTPRAGGEQGASRGRAGGEHAPNIKALHREPQTISEAWMQMMAEPDEQDHAAAADTATA